MVYVIKTTVEDGKKTVREMALTDSTWERILDKKLREDNVSYELKTASKMPKGVELSAGDETKKVEPKVETPKVETPKVEPKVETPKVETPKVETPKVTEPSKK